MIEVQFAKFLAERKLKLVLYAIIVSCAVIHTPAHFIEQWLRFASVEYGPLFLTGTGILYTVNAIRSLLFLISITILFGTFVVPVGEFLRQRKSEYDKKKIFLNSIIVFFAAAVLVLPFRLGIMGVGYAEMSKDPFNFQDASNQIYQRLLVPGIAYFLQFKGPVLYHLFSLLLTLILIFCTLLFLRTRGIRTSFLENLSIAGSSFIITQFQSPGYTEQLSLIIILLIVIVPLGFLPRIAGVALALFAHEVSALVILAAGLLYFSKEEKLWTGFVIFIYASFWLMSFGLDPGRLLAVRSIGGQSGFVWLINHPLRELGGIAASYKLLWILLFIALFKAVDRKQIALFILPGILATMLGVDTSRLMAFSFLAVLIAIAAIKRDSLVSDRYLRLLFGLNLVLPSVYVGLNSGLVYFDGLYQLLYHGLFLR